MLEFKPFSDFISIIGMKAAGKTYRTLYYSHELQRIIAIDPTWQLGELGYCVHYPERITPAFLEYKKVIYQPMHMDQESYTRAFREILRHTNFTCIIDEIDKFASSHGYLCEEVNEIINRGRAQGIGLVCNTRRPFLLHKDIRGNSDHVVCYQLMEIDDRIYMEKWIGVDRLKLKQLPVHHAYYYDVHRAKLTLENPLK